MYAKDFRQRAWDSLSGKWGTFAIIYLIYTFILGAIEGVGAINPVNAVATVLLVVVSVISFLINGPFEYGIKETALLVARGKEIRVDNLFNGFHVFEKSFLLYLINNIFIFLWSLLFIIPGIIKSLSYSMSFFILQENPDISPNEARKQSMEMMNGNKWRLFCLELSFIGWILLSILTFGILFFWVLPYMNVAHAEFYLSLKGEDVQEQITEKAEKSEE